MILPFLGHGVLDSSPPSSLPPSLLYQEWTKLCKLYWHCISPHYISGILISII